MDTQIERQWQTETINVEEFASALRTTFELSNDNESLYTACLSFGPGKDLILKLHPPERKVFIALPSDSHGFFLTAKIFDVSVVGFVQFRNSENGQMETDIMIHSIGGMSIVVSSWKHRAFE